MARELESVNVCGDIRATVAYSDLAYVEMRWWPNRVHYVVITQGPLPKSGKHQCMKVATFKDALTVLLSLQWATDTETDKVVGDPCPTPEEFLEWEDIEEEPAEEEEIDDDRR